MNTIDALLNTRRVMDTGAGYVAVGQQLTPALVKAYAANPGMEVDAFAKVETLSPGEYVRMVDSKGKIGVAVYVVDGYCCINRGYMVTRYYDASRDKKLVKGTIVHVGFDF